MRMPNNVGYVAECLEERPLVLDKETGKQIPGEFQVRFKLKLRNTHGQELVVWAVLEDPTFKEEVDGFLNPVPKAYSRVARTVEELAEQLDADLNGPKDFHDKVVDEAEISNLGAEPRTLHFIRMLNMMEVELKKRIDQYLAKKLGI